MIFEWSPDSLMESYFTGELTLKGPIIYESCIEIKSELNFYFFTLSGIGPLRVKTWGVIFHW